MAQYALNVAERSRFARLVEAGLMPAALLLPRMSSKQRVSFICATAARGLLPDLARIATESASVDARAADALVEEDPETSRTFRVEADFWIAFAARHPDPRRRWHRGDQGLASRPCATGLRATKAPVISPPEAVSPPPAGGEISTTVVFVPPTKVQPDSKGNEAPIAKCSGRSCRRRSPGSSAIAEEAPRDLPAWAQDVLESLPPLVTRAATAKVLGVSEKTVDRRIDEHVLIAVYIGSRVLIPRLALVGYLVTQSR